MKKVQLLNRSLSELPCEVIWDILCSLPIKTCLSCKLVCKDWYKIIISPHFAGLRRSHCSHLVSLMLHCRLPNRRWNFLLLELDKELSNADRMGNIRVGKDSVIKFKPNFNFPKGKLHIANVCNELVCLKSDKKWGSYYICNFLTSRFVMVEQFKQRSHFLHGYVLGSCPISITRVCEDFDESSLTLANREVNFGGSNSITRQYKLLRILRIQAKYVAEVLTLGSNKWRRIHDAPNSCYKFQAFLNSSFHWYDNWNNKCNIWAFNFAAERFLTIPTPDEFNVRPYAALTVFDSCLCFCCINGDGLTSTESEVWLMKEYGVGHSWVKELVIHVPEPLVYSRCKPVVRMNNGQILIKQCESSLALYDPETRTYTPVKVDGVSYITKLEACDANFSWVLGGVQGD